MKYCLTGGLANVDTNVEIILGPDRGRAFQDDVDHAPQQCELVRGHFGVAVDDLADICEGFLVHGKNYMNFLSSSINALVESIKGEKVVWVSIYIVTICFLCSRVFDWLLNILLFRWK